MSISHDVPRIYLDNVRTNQIGGETDGIPEEVAADLGYSTWEKAVALLSPHTPDQLVIDDGASMTLARRDELLEEAFTAAALAKKAQGRADNVHARSQIAQRIGTSVAGVNEHGEKAKSEHMRRLSAAMLGLSGNLPADDATKPYTAEDFLEAYYDGSKGAKRARNATRRAINRRNNG